MNLLQQIPFLEVKPTGLLFTFVTTDRQSRGYLSQIIISISIVTNKLS